jgi:large subunit ribosomal protein L29
MAKYSELKTLNVKEIDKKVLELKKELFGIKMQGAVTGYEKPHRLNDLKKDIARLLTAKSANK